MSHDSGSSAGAVSSAGKSRAPQAGQVVGLTIGEYLLQRLQDYGVRHAFGIPGDYILTFYSMMYDSPMRVINCCSEDGAGFAADAYARINGMGVVCVTYCVGGLKVCNPIAGAFAEKSPVVLISGAPGMNERPNNPLLHHKVKEFRTQLEVFEKLCVAVTELTDPSFAFREIDRVLDACARHKRPVYIEIPRDMVTQVPEAPYRFQRTEPLSDPAALAEAVSEAERMLSASERPLVLAGVEVHRFGLQNEVMALAEGSQIPIAATMLGKSVVRETHPLYVGLYEGAMGRDEVTQYVEDSDCVVLLGTFMTDINLGIFTANLDTNRCIYATSEQLRIRNHYFEKVLLPDFIRELTKRRVKTPSRPLPQRPEVDSLPYQVQTDAPLCINRLMARLNTQLDDKTIVITDVGDAMFAATELVTHGQTEYLSPAYYTSMGFAVPAALGSQAARPDLRTIVLVGDGAFQMNGMEMSTIIRNGFNPIIIVLDNHGYGTERFLHPGDFNEIQPWKYHLLPHLIGGGKGYEVRTEGEFDTALRAAWQDTSGLSLIQAHLGVDDCSEGLKRLAARLGIRVRGVVQQH